MCACGCVPTSKVRGIQWESVYEAKGRENYERMRTKELVAHEEFGFFSCLVFVKIAVSLWRE